MPKRNDILSLVSRYRTELMGFAALWILADHEWVPLLENHFLGRVERILKEMGYYGVDFFLFLSGMGLVYAIGKYSLKEFYKRRFVRILVPVVFTMGLIGIDRGWDFLFFLKAVTCYQFWTVYIYTALWYVYAIMTLYLLFPLYHCIFKKVKAPVVFTAVLIAVWLAGSNLLSGTMRYDLYGFTNRIPVFLTGVLVGRLLLEKKQLFFSWYHWVACVVALLAGFVLYYLVCRGVYVLVPASECCLPSYLIAVSGSCLLSQTFALLDSTKIGKTLLRGLAFYGTLSLELYCVQDFMQGKLLIAMAQRVPNPVANLVNIWAITVAAYLLSRLTQPIYRMLKYR